jgi:hypothetical protein
VGSESPLPTSPPGRFLSADFGSVSVIDRLSRR